MPENNYDKSIAVIENMLANIASDIHDMKADVKTFNEFKAITEERLKNGNTRFSDLREKYDKAEKEFDEINEIIKRMPSMSQVMKLYFGTAGFITLVVGIFKYLG